MKLLERSMSTYRRDILREAQQFRRWRNSEVCLKKWSGLLSMSIAVTRLRRAQCLAVDSMTVTHVVK